MKDREIYIDMDGVLARWNTEASIEDTYKPGYFLYREEETSVAELIDRLVRAGYPVTILSAAYEEGTAREDKKKWLEQHGIKVPRLFVPYGQKKSDFVKGNRNAVLVDDYSRNLREWEDAGFTGVKFYNGINGNHGTWHGYSIDHRMSVDKMFVVVSAIAEAGR